MGRAAIISVDGHVKAPRAGYRDYIDPKWRDTFDDWLQSFEGTPDGFVRAEFGEDAQWDPKQRIADHGDPGRDGRDPVRERCAVRGGPRRLRARPRADPPGQHGVQSVGDRLLLRGTRPVARAGAGVLRRRRPSGERRPLGQGAGPRRHPDAAALPRLEVLLRPRARPDLGRVPGRRPAAQPARRHRGTRLPARRSSPRSWCSPPSTRSSPAGRCGSSSSAACSTGSPS